MSDAAVCIVTGVVVAAFLGLAALSEAAGYHRGFEDGRFIGRTESGYADGYLAGRETAEMLNKLVEAQP